MKKVFLVLMLFVTVSYLPAFAGGRGCPGGGHHPCRPCPPPRPYHPCRPCRPGWGYGWNCNRDLGNAAAITSIVANGLAIANNLCQPIVYANPVAPIVQPTVAAPITPAVVAQPSAVAVPAPAVVAPQPAYVSAPAPCVAPTVVAPYGRAGRVVYYGF